MSMRGKRKSGSTVPLSASKSALGMLAKAANQCNSQEDCALQPDMPCQVQQKKGWPALVVLVAYAVARRPWALSWSDPQQTRCASPKRMLE